MALFSESMPEEQLWPMYFGGEQLNGEDLRVPFMLALADHFAGPRKAAIRQQVERRRAVYLNLTGFDEEVPVENFTQMLRQEPVNVLGCLELAIHLMLLRDGVELESRVFVRILNFGPQQQFQQLMRSSNVGKFVTLHGTVVRMSSVQPMVESMHFVCPACDTDTEVHFPDGKYEPPLGCTDSDCKSRSMQPDRSSAVTVDYQKIRVQELFSDTGAEVGRVPRSIEVELKHDLVDSCLPGDIVTVSGIIKAQKAESRSGGSKQETCLYILYMVANSIVSNKRKLKGTGLEESYDISSGSGIARPITNSSSSFTLQDLQAIRCIYESSHLFELLVSSLCPGIFGHELVKAGLCLGLFSGVRRQSDSLHKVPMRGDIHVLMLGDPGMGKSQLLRACTVVAPRSVYVCGNSTTTAGLTVSMVKDGNGNSALEAGALVLADCGLCCIDEFDKISSDPQALLEALEQQSISIAKAGICCSLSARATVFVAANPIGGHYNRTKTMVENMKISPALLSRFDLVFVLVDKPDVRRDELLSEHVLDLHSSTTYSTQSSKASYRERTVASQTQTANKLVDRIKQFRGSSRDFEPIPPELLRKYIAYAKEFLVRPRLSDDAKKILKSFYLDLRRQRSSADNSHVTIRQLESLVRLSEARARMELRETITGQDADDAVEIMKASLFDLYSDNIVPEGVVFNDTNMHGSKKTAVLMKALRRAARDKDSSLFSTKELVEVFKSAGIVTSDYKNLIVLLNQQNFILCKGVNQYQVLDQ